MIRFNCDYHEGAHPRIMEALVKTNMVQTVGYGVDEYCKEAKEVIKNFTPMFTKEEFLAYLDATNRSGDRIIYKENGAEIIL